MVIDQRNNGASVTPTNGQYLVDRFKAYLTQASKYTAQQNAGSVTPPSGFKNYLGVTSSSAYSVVSSDYFGFAQPIEGFNIADLGWGTASAQTITLSFWVRSSLTGTFGGALASDGSANRAYPFTYTISAANTWEYKTITVPGDTTGAWLSTSGMGVEVRFGLGAGSTWSGTAGAWGSGNFLSATGAVSIVGTNGATFYVTGAQFEKGSTATSFDYRPYGTELALCMRYAYQYVSPSAKGVGDGTNMTRAGFNHPVPMRAAPTATLIGTVPTYDGSTVRNISSILNSYMTSTVFEVDFATGGSVAGRAMTIYQGTGSILVSAEL
jgi:hypothetical protein